MNICPHCKKEVPEFTDDIIRRQVREQFISEQVKKVVFLNKQLTADARAMATTYSNLLKMFNLDGKSGTQVLMQLPKILNQVQKNPEMFNFINPDLQLIIDKYAKNGV
ncbi:MAG: hypothetical protein NTX61_08200 [Bacteroidetes bacterium]|nr:hypothetical protein [Bacteroidota bacterium]